MTIESPLTVVRVGEIDAMLLEAIASVTGRTTEAVGAEDRCCQ